MHETMSYVHTQTHGATYLYMYITFVFVGYTYICYTVVVV